MEYKEPDLIPHKNIIWEKVIETNIFLLIILVPLVFYPHCIDTFRTIKEFVAEILMVISLMFWGFKVIGERDYKLTHTFLDLHLFSFMIVIICSLFWSDSRFVSLKELPLFLLGPALYFVITNNIKSERQIKQILSVAIFMGSLMGIYGILQYQGIDFSFWRGNIGRQEVFGLFGNVNYFAEYLISLLPLAVSLFFVTSIKFK